MVEGVVAEGERGGQGWRRGMSDEEGEGEGEIERECVGPGVEASQLPHSADATGVLSNQVSHPVTVHPDPARSCPAMLERGWGGLSACVAEW